MPYQKNYFAVTKESNLNLTETLIETVAKLQGLF